MRSIRNFLLHVLKAFGISSPAGNALAVMYSIYRGGYRKAVEDSLIQPQPESYLAALSHANKKVRASS